MVAARVQHHPSRAHLLPAMLAALRPLPVEVVEHSSDPPSPWGGYKLCLQDIPDCSHLLVIQDDAVPSPGFVPAVEAIAAAQPDTPVCLFLSRLPRDAAARAEKAMRQHVRYVPIALRSFCPIVAMLWPRAKAVEFAEWAAEHPYLHGRVETRSDDAMAGRWKMVTRQQVLACVPSIVEHPDEVESTIGKRPQWGKDRARSAALLADDATGYDWSAR